MMGKIKNPKEIILTISAILFVLTLIGVVFWPALTTPGIPSGVDTPSFLHTAKFMVDYLVKYHTLPPTDPQWYSGLEYLHYAPPLIYVPIGIFYYLTNDIRWAGKLFQILIIGLAALSMFFVVKKRHGKYSAMIAALLFPLAPWTFFQLGSPTKLLAALFFPICFYFAEKVVEEKKKVDLVLLAIFFLIVLLSHPMMGLIFMAGMSIYTIFYTGLNKRLSITRAVLVIIAAILSVSLGAYFVVPYYFEKAGWTVIPQQELINYSHPLNTVFLYTGIPLVIFGLYSAFRYRDARRIGLLVMGTVGGFLSLGIFGAGFIYEAFPFLKVTYPGLWLNLPVFAFSYLTATAIDLEKIKGVGKELKKAVLAVLIIAIAVIATIPVDHFTQLKNKKSDISDVIVTSRLNSFKNFGRVTPMKYPYGYLVWELSDRTNKNITEGHYFGLARIGKYISWKYDAIDHGYINYPFNFLVNHNVKYIIVTGNLLKSRKNYGKKFVRKFSEAGFTKKFSVSGYYGTIYDVYEKQGKSSYLMPVTGKTLVIGNYAYTPAALLSEREKALIGGSPFIDDYSEEILKNFRTLILYGFAYRNRSRAEDLVRSFLKKGGRVIVDLYGAKPYGTEENPQFLDVTGHLRTAEDGFEIEKVSDKAENYFAYETFDPPFELSNSGQIKERLKEWRYMIYVGLDEPIVRLKNDDSDGIYGVAGFKNLKEGKVLFVGPNFFYHSYLTRNQKQLEKVALLTGNSNETNGVQSSHLGAVKEENPRVYAQSIKPAKIWFKYTSKHAFPALVSYAFSRHWQAFVDGKKINVHNIEDLMLVNLPKGEHTLTILYKDTPIHTFARAISLMTFFLFGWLIFKDRKRKKYADGHDGNL